MSSSDDPHKAREALKYDNPVASREFIAQALVDAKEPMKLEALAEHFGYDTESDAFEGLRRRVVAMQRDGQIVANRLGGFMPVDEASLVAGRIQAHPDGFGFLIADDGDDDIFLHAKAMRQVLHGDRVIVSITGTDRRGRREGRIINIVERAHKTLVGRFIEEQGVMSVSPDNKRIHLDVMVGVAGRNGANSGDIVVVELTEQPTRKRPPVGKVVEVLGPELKAGMEIDVALRSHDIPHVWPDAVTAEADSYGAGVQNKDILGRKDIRTLPMMTIDGSDARDFDDAVYAEHTAKGFRLLVAIADVAHYVKPESALDSEATMRGTSVYFPGQVVPMLPEVLSNGLCSLNPEVDRLCMLCELTLDESGGIKRTRFFNAVMKSHARLTYDNAWEMLSDPASTLREKHSDVVKGLDTLYELYKVLRAARTKRGVIEFESNETRIIFDEDRKIKELKPIVRNDAHKLIEECMISANIAAAAFIERQKIPALYRVHQGPKSDKLEDLRSFLSFRGLSIGGGDSPTPLDYARLSKSIAQRADRSIIETTMLRSMQQAVYQPKNEGHFGLALTQYAHFTSPIRRYPDLLIHRAIKFSLSKKPIETYNYSHPDMQVLGESCSMTERRAEEASRDVLSWLKCEFMQSRVGDEFDGVVSTVTSFGLFVLLNDLHVEGLVHITSLVKDYYRFDQAEGALIGEKTGRQYRLGEAIKVRVAAVNLDDRKIDFQEIDTGPRLQKSTQKESVMDPKVRQKSPKKSKSQLRRDKQRSQAKEQKRKDEKVAEEAAKNNATDSAERVVSPSKRVKTAQTHKTSTTSHNAGQPKKGPAASKRSSKSATTAREGSSNKSEKKANGKVSNKNDTKVVKKAGSKASETASKKASEKASKKVTTKARKKVTQREPKKTNRSAPKTTAKASTKKFAGETRQSSDQSSSKSKTNNKKSDGKRQSSKTATKKKVSGASLYGKKKTSAKKSMGKKRVSKKASTHKDAGKLKVKKLSSNKKRNKKNS